MDSISNGPPTPVAPSPASPAYRPPPPAPKTKPHGCLGAFLGFCFALAFLLLISLVSLRLTLFNPDFWKTWLSESRAYESATQTLLPTLFSSLTLSSPGQESPAIEPIYSGTALPTDQATLVPSDLPEKLSRIVSDVVTPRWLQQQAEGAIDGFFHWLAVPGQGLRITIDLKPLRQPLETGIKQILQDQFQTLPVCTYSAQTATVDTEMNCRPSGTTFDQVWVQIQGENQGSLFGADFPEEYVIDEQQFQAMVEPLQAQQAIPFGQNLIQSLADPPQVYQALMLWLWISLAITAGLAALMIWLYRRAVPSMLKILGIPILVISALLLAGNLIILFVGSAGVSSLLSAGQSSGLTEAVTSQQQALNDLAVPLIKSWLAGVTRPALWLDGACLAGSIVMLVMAAVLRRKSGVSK